MQTFLPYPDLYKSALVIDAKRRWKQVVEARQLINTLTGVSEGWKNHPALKMWIGYVSGLQQYADVMLRVVREQETHNVKAYDYFRVKHYCLPPWFGDYAFHESHRSNLLRKDETFYRKYGWTEPTDLPYIWPSNNSNISS